MSIPKDDAGPSAARRSSASSPAIKLLAVVVIYKMRPHDSSTLQTLLAAAANTSSDLLDLKIVVWDNTPGGQDNGELTRGILYKSAPHNPGLAQAYNQALEVAEGEGYEWLLTLDQDSSLPADFLARIAGLARELGPAKTVGAIVPQVIADGRIISPFQFRFGALPHWFSRGFVGISKRAAYAANSGATLRVSALREIGGYDPLFPLDLSDTNLFHRLHGSGKSVFIAGDILFHHDLALLNKQARMSIGRYEASLWDDCAFWDLYMGPIARFERIVRFAGRACKDFLISREGGFWKPTLSELRRRILTPRHKRIVEWKIWAASRLGGFTEGSNPRPQAIEPSSGQFTPTSKG
jgi:GT2 family glycosyltransferase